ncbi:AaceriABL184Wp [[Ashbya] aceris (nom. inval.)]|nr:AaceriABL184Wp [[Ashbya] aceris (nom. inval.)]
MTGQPTPVKLDSATRVQSFLDQYDTFLFDCDGVLWLGTHLLPLVKETLAMLAAKGKKLYFVTNNSTKSRAAYAKKFASFGITVGVEQIFTSSYAAALHVRDVLQLTPGTDKIWVFGEAGIEDELQLMGYEGLGGSDQRLDAPFAADTSPFLTGGLDPAVRAVVAGLDTHLNYHRLSVTLQYLQRPDVAFVATNLDNTLPQKGLKLPGAGTMIQCLATASGREPQACGKPNQNMLKSIIAATGLDRTRTCMVGDRLNTDMRFGADGGLGTLLVLTGIETEEGALAPSSEHPQPAYYADKLGSLYELSESV